MDPRMIPRGAASEYNRGDSGIRPDNQPGVYFHPQAGKFIETSGTRQPDGSITYAQKSGKIQADAFTQVGFRPATAEELKEYRAKQAERAKAQHVKDTATSVSMSDSAKR